ncbi:MAG: hypothetical protein ACPIOQ_31510, partial [Promethearchaeia archaeon]
FVLHFVLQREILITTGVAMAEGEVHDAAPQEAKDPAPGSVSNWADEMVCGTASLSANPVLCLEACACFLVSTESPPRRTRRTRRVQSMTRSGSKRSPRKLS